MDGRVDEIDIELVGMHWPRTFDRAAVAVSYSVDIERNRLHCRSKVSAERAARTINSDKWMRAHLKVSPGHRMTVKGTAAWHLCIDECDGCDWDEPSAERVWYAVRKFMAEGALLEFRHEEGFRFRIAWRNQRAFDESVEQTLWKVDSEINGGR